MPVDISTNQGARSSAPPEILEKLPELLSAGRFSDIEGQLLAKDVRLRALLPRGPERQDGAADVVRRMRDWFEAPAVELDDCRIAPVGDRWLLAYRLLVGEGPERTVVSQQCVCEVVDDRIHSIDLVCSGFRPLPNLPNEGAAVRFDAGTLGCADGLAQAFRDRIAAVPVGGVLEVVTADPAAREDLPPMARMLGHAVVRIDSCGEGRTLIAVERRK